MPLQFQIQQTGFAFGVQEGVDPHHVPFGVLTRAEDVRWTKSKRLEKRYGVAALTTSCTDGTTLASCARLVGGKTLGLLGKDNAGALVYAEYASSRASWRKLAADVSPYGASWTTAVDDVNGVATSDLAVTSNGYEVQVFITGDPLYNVAASTDYARYIVRDAATGNVVVSTTLLGQFGRACKVVANGTSAYILVGGGTGATVTVYTLDTTTMTLSSATNLRTDAANQLAFDACMVNGSLVIAYARNTGANRLAFHMYTPGTWTQTQTDVSGETATSFREIAIAHGGSDLIFVLYYASGSELLRWTTLNATTLAPFFGPNTIETTATSTTGARHLGVSWVAAGEYLLSYSWISLPGPSFVTRATTRLYTAGAISTTVVYATSNAQWATRPALFDGKWIGWLNTNTDYPANRIPDPYNAVAVAIPMTARPGSTDYVPHQRIATGETFIGGQAGNRGIPKMYAYGSTLVAAVTFLSATPNRRVYRLGIRRVVIETGAADHGRSGQLGPLRLVNAGQLSSADGETLFPYGFLHPPSIRQIAASGAGSSIPIGTYTWSPISEWRDANGTLFRSPTTIPVSFTTVGPTAVQQDCSSHVLDAHQTDYTLLQDLRPVKMITYRTAASGSTYYRATMEPITNSYSNNDPLSSTTAVIDDASPTAVDGVNLPLTSRPVLYTTGGILDDYAPPGITTFVVHRRRIWVVDGSRRQLWFSKTLDDDQGTAPGFNVAFRILTEEDVVALASMDDKLIIFSRTGIAYLLGDGPNAAGQGSDLGAPNPIQTDVGCINPRSVVSTPDGVMFQGANGLYLLTRGLEVVWLGRPVQDVLASYPDITSAVLVPNRSEVRFTTNNTAANAGRTLVWNYVEKQWSVSKYLSGAAIADACMWNDTWCFATPVGAVYTESNTDWTDAGTYVPMLLETAWISAGGPLAFHSVRLFSLTGLSWSNHDLTIECAFDSETTYVQSRAFLAGSDVTAVGGLEECDIAIGTRRKCKSIRFRIFDSTPTAPGTYPVGTGRGPSFDTMGIEVGMKAGFSTSSATRKG